MHMYMLYVQCTCTSCDMYETIVMMYMYMYSYWTALLLSIRSVLMVHLLMYMYSIHASSLALQSILCRFPSSVTSMAVHPLEPHYLAVGLGDGTIRLLDRRRTDYWQDSGAGEPLFLGAGCSLVKYRPASLGDQKLKITSVNFNHSGTEILASYSEDYVYLFNSGLHGVGSDITLTQPHISKPLYLSQCERYPGGRARRSRVHRKPITLQGRTTATETSPIATNDSSGDSVPSVQGASEGEVRGHDRSSPAAKRIRLRGDWSDTGPEARPESQSEPPQGAGLMNRMSRMFARWVNMSLDNISGEEGEGEEGEGRERERGSESSSDEMSLYLSSESDEVGPTDEDVTDPRPHRDELQERDRVDADMDHVLQEETGRARNSAVGEATEGVMRSAVQEATESAMRSAVQEAIDRAMEGAVREAMDRAVDEAERRPVDITRADTAIRDETDVKSDTVDCAVDGQTSRNSGGDGAELAVDDTVDKTVDNGEDTAGERAREHTITDPMQHLAEKTKDNVRENATDTSARNTSLSRGDSSEMRASPRDRLSSTGSSPRGAACRPLATEVRETSSPSFPSETSPVYGKSCDQSYDRSHDHSYRRSRFKVQRRREGRGDDRRDLAEGKEETLKGQSAEEEEEEEAEVNRRLMRETTRSVQNHLQPFMVYKGHRNSRTMVHYM